LTALRVTRTAIAAALAVVVAGGLAAAPGARAADSPSPSSSPKPGTDNAPLRVTITTLSPVSIGPADTITIKGTVTNVGDEPLDDLSPIVGVGDEIDSRATLTRDLTAAPVLRDVLTPATPPVAPSSLAPGGSGTFAMTIAVHGSGLDTDHSTVYPLQVRFDSGRRTSLGQANTFLPYFPGSVANPLRIVWLWPLDSPPAVDAYGRISDPDVPATFQSGGRLQTLLALTQPPAGASGAAAQYAPVTFALEPSLLGTIATVSRAGWTRSVDTGGSKDTPTDRVASTAAADWLNELRAATRGADVLALPYADPDAVALVRAGMATDLANAIALGRAQVTAALPSAQVPTVAWPANGNLDQATLDAYAAAGATSVLVDGDQIPDAADADLTTQTAPTLLETRGPQIRALAIDDEAQKLLAGNGHDAPSPEMGAQEVLALLAVVVGERPNGGDVRDLVLAMPRDLDPDATWARDLLHDTATLPWLSPVRLGQTTADPTGERTTLQPYPQSAQAAELAQSSLNGPVNSVAALRRQVADVRGMLPDDTLTRPLDDALSRAESLAWRTKTPAGSQDALLAGVAQRANALLGSVTLAVSGQVTLTSRDGKVPITVRNTLTEPVTVDITLSAADPTKLAPAGARRYVIAPGQKQRVLLPAKTQRAGTFRVDLDVTTPDGRKIATAPLTVHSTAYGTITLVITLAALGVLVLAIGRRLFRRIRGWRAAARTAEPTAAG
jgi:hypothetical protein